MFKIEEVIEFPLVISLKCRDILSLYSTLLDLNAVKVSHRRYFIISISHYYDMDEMEKSIIFDHSKRASSP